LIAPSAKAQATRAAIADDAAPAGPKPGWTPPPYSGRR